MKVVSYNKVIPVKNKSREKEDILKKFLIGVKKTNDTAIFHNDFSLVPCDVALIQGWQHEYGKTAKHLKLRQDIVNFQLLNKKHVCVADSNLFLYATPNNEPHHYLRYSFDGVFPNTGIYFDDTIDTKRWNQISKDLGIRIESQKNSGSYVLICLQRQGGWSMGSTSLINWINYVVEQIKQYSDRPIVLRPHPKDNNTKQYFSKIDKTLKISTNKSIEEDLKNAWCVVNHNSSSVVGPIIKGYPAFITDPLKSQCSEVCHHSFKNIETPLEFDRLKWLQRISMFHWKFSELEDGTAWQHMRNYVFQ